MARKSIWVLNGHFFFMEIGQGSLVVFSPTRFSVVVSILMVSRRLTCLRKAKSTLFFSYSFLWKLRRYNSNTLSLPHKRPHTRGTGENIILTRSADHKQELATIPVDAQSAILCDDHAQACPQKKMVFGACPFFSPLSA